jgi:archaellum component FlaC
MLGQVMVTTESPSMLKPLLRAAIQNEAKVLTHGIKRTRERLTTFEKQFGMTSEEFERRYAAAEIDESLESIEWLGEIKMLHVLSEQKLALDGARVK